MRRSSAGLNSTTNSTHLSSNGLPAIIESPPNLSIAYLVANECLADSARKENPLHRQRKVSDGDYSQLIVNKSFSDSDSEMYEQDTMCVAAANRRPVLSGQNSAIMSSNCDITASTARGASHQSASSAETSYTCAQLVYQSRHVPLPKLEWTDSREVWRLMCKKDEKYRRDPQMLTRHPRLKAQMRAVLLDWMSEVADLYQLHRETYHLSVDFVDRYLSSFTGAKLPDEESPPGLPKSMLQLVGTTALYIAAKLEEIYPPTVADFAYVTDGACTDDQIHEQEVLLLKDLNWYLSPLTANNWLNTHLQTTACGLVAGVSNSGGSGDGFEFPRYSAYTFQLAVRLIDLCLLDIESLKFSYSALAASALYHVHGDSRAMTLVSGYEWAELEPCVTWMSHFARTVSGLPPILARHVAGVPLADQHHIQTRGFGLEVLDMVHNARRAASPNADDLLAIYPTPPNSQERTVSTSTKYASDGQPQGLV